MVGETSRALEIANTNKGCDGVDGRLQVGDGVEGEGLERWSTGREEVFVVGPWGILGLKDAQDRGHIFLRGSLLTMLHNQVGDKIHNLGVARAESVGSGNWDRRKRILAHRHVGVWWVRREGWDESLRVSELLGQDVRDEVRLLGCRGMVWHASPCEVVREVVGAVALQDLGGLVASFRRAVDDLYPSEPPLNAT